MNKTTKIPKLDRDINIINKKVIDARAASFKKGLSQGNVSERYESSNNIHANMDGGGPSSKSGLRKKLLITLFTIIFAVGIIYYAWHKTMGGRYVATDNAYVAGDVINVSSQVSGTVDAVYVENTNKVETGDKLVTLSAQNYKLALQKAQSALANTVRSLNTQYSNVGQYSALLQQQRVALKKAQDDYARRLPLAKNHIISQEELAHAWAAVQSARAAIAVTQKQENIAQANTNGVSLQNHPAVLQAKASFIEAWLNYERTTILAPATGYIAKKSVQIGTAVSAGTPLMAIVPLNSVWVDANFKETQLSTLRVNQPVKVTTDLYGDHVVFHGRVVGLSAGTGTAFSLIPAQNATGNWIKIVQRVPVRISLDPLELQEHPLRVGLSAKVKVDVEDQTGVTLALVASGKPLFTTNIYSDNTAAASSIADKIIKANVYSPSSLHKKAQKITSKLHHKHIPSVSGHKVRKLKHR